MNNLKILRESKNLSLAKLQKELENTQNIKLSRASLSNYENEEQTPRPETWEILAKFYDVSVPYIMGLSDNPRELTVDDLLDLQGNKLFETYEDAFNTQVSTMEILKLFCFKIKNSEQRKVFYVIKLTDPTNSMIRHTCLEAIFNIDFLDMNINKDNVTYEVPCSLAIPNKEDAISQINTYRIQAVEGVIEGLTSETFDPMYFYFYSKSKEILDKENSNTNQIDNLLKNILEKTFNVVLTDQRKDIFMKNSNAEYVFNVNYFNKEIKKITI